MDHQVSLARSCASSIDNQKTKESELHSPQHWNDKGIFRKIAQRSIGRKFLNAVGPRYIKWNTSDFALFLDLHDSWGVSKHILKHDHYDLELCALVKKLLPTNSTCLDIGANIGFWSTYLATSCRAKKVYSFEPEPQNLSLLRYNIELNKNTDRVHIFPVAVGAAKSKLKLHLSADNAGDHQLYATAESRDTVEVDVEPIDSLLPDQDVNFIKIDVQGYEPYVFSGMSSLLERNRQIVVLVEYWPDGISRAGADPQAFLNSLLQMGFKFHFFSTGKNALQEIPLAEIAKRIQPGHHIDLVLSRTALH